MQFPTPLRYPGGKGRLAHYVAEIIELNELHGGGYAEPFCGGAGIALSLLFAEKVGHIYLNDIDRSVYAFWHTAVHQNEELCRRIQDTPVDMDTWHRQRAVQDAKESADLIDLGFSTFFLNRTNRSGILMGGVIGGKEQTGKWKIDARFVKKALIERVELLGYYANNITVSQADVANFIDKYVSKMPLNTLIYFDPPYFNKGQKLYQNHFAGKDHERLAEKIQSSVKQPWIVSYDNVDKISALYSSQDQEVFSLNYSAHLHTQGSELMVFKEGLDVPERVYTSRAMVA